jgi:hypothetical protein
MTALMFMLWAPDGHQATGMSALVWLQFDQAWGPHSHPNYDPTSSLSTSIPHLPASYLGYTETEFNISGDDELMRLPLSYIFFFFSVLSHL